LKRADRPLEEVFKLDQADYVKGTLARLIDKDDQPKWRPAAIEKAGDLDLELKKYLWYPTLKILKNLLCF